MKLAALRYGLVLLAACVVLWAEDPSWKQKPIEEWNEHDAKLVLTDSPWAKITDLRRVRALSPDEARAGGDMQASEHVGVGLAGIGVLGPAMQAEAMARVRSKPDPGKVLVRWESADPVRAAEQKTGNTEAQRVGGDYYSVAVYGAPLPDHGGLEGELKAVAILQRYNRKDLKAARVVILRKENGRGDVLYLFPRSEEIGTRDEDVGFYAQIGRLVVNRWFSLEAMEIAGRLEL